MEHKHTPGPWSKSYDGHGGICITGSDGRQVGFVSAGSDQEGNANRMVAVPELLEALFACVEPTEPGEDCPLPPALYNKVCAAIAKATGEPQ